MLSLLKKINHHLSELLFASQHLLDDAMPQQRRLPVKGRHKLRLRMPATLLGLQLRAPTRPPRAEPHVRPMLQPAVLQRRPMPPARLQVRVRMPEGLPGCSLRGRPPFAGPHGPKEAAELKAEMGN